MTKPGEKPTCFIAMPITAQQEHIERYGGDEDHWGHVMGSLFEKSIEQAGFNPIRPAAQGSHLIHGLIIRHLSTADLVLVDLSTHNPNVFFELGVRTSLNLPIALVRDEYTNIPFDTSGINTYSYDSKLRGWEIEQQQQSLARHVQESYASCEGQNPLWRQFGLTIKASEPDANESPLEAKVDLLMGQLAKIQDRLEVDGAMAHSDTRAGSHDTPARQFAGALLRDLDQHPPSESIIKHISIVDNASVDIDLNVSPSKSLARFIEQLAGTYGVRAVFRYRGNSATSQDRTRGTGDGTDDLAVVEPHEGER